MMRRTALWVVGDDNPAARWVSLIDASRRSMVEGLSSPLLRAGLCHVCGAMLRRARHGAPPEGRIPPRSWRAGRTGQQALINLMCADRQRCSFGLADIGRIGGHASYR